MFSIYSAVKDNQRETCPSPTKQTDKYSLTGRLVGELGWGGISKRVSGYGKKAAGMWLRGKTDD